MSNTEKALTLLLRLSAAVLLLALVPVFMPQAWMSRIHQALGMGPLPELPIVGYLTRSLSGLYAFHGLLVLYCSLDVRRYLPIIRCLAAVSVLGGGGLLALDCVLGMPWLWTLGEGPFLMVWWAGLLSLSAAVDGRAAGKKRDRADGQ
jgi:hypothetical protein